MEREMMKGNTPGLILAVLEDGPLHGYGIAREIERRSGQALQFKEGTLYPQLHALEKSGWVEARWETPGGPARKTYGLTPDGEDELKRRRALWHRFARAVESVLGPQGSQSKGGEADATQ